MVPWLEASREEECLEARRTLFLDGGLHVHVLLLFDEYCDTYIRICILVEIELSLSLGGQNMLI